MLMEAERRSDREGELLFHSISIAEFQCEMLKKKNQVKKPISNIPIPNV